MHVLYYSKYCTVCTLQYVQYERMYVCTVHTHARMCLVPSTYSKYVVIGRGFGHQSGQDESSGQNPAAIWTDLLLRVYLGVS